MMLKKIMTLSAHPYSVVLLLLAPAGLLAAENISETMCVHPDSTVTRSIEVIYQSDTSPIPCQVLYGEDGVLNEVASAKNTPGHCEKQERKIAKNLVNAGWQCSNSLFGASTQSQSDLVLNLFPDSLQRKKPHKFDNSDVDAELEQHQIYLAEKFESEHRSDLEQKLVEILESQIADDLSVMVEVEAKITVNRNSGLPARGPELTDAADHDTSWNIDSEPDSFKAAPLQYSHALMSKPLESEQQAHQFASELRRLYPNVNTKVSQNVTATDQWSVVLGIANAAAELNTAMALLDENTQNYFSLVDLADSTEKTGAHLEFVSNDWPRYVIAACYSEGQSTLLSMAECSGFDLGVDSFLNCVSGGVCSPKQYSGALSQNNVDLEDALSTNNPVAAARGILAISVRGCESMTNATDSELAECIALSILDEEQQWIMECYNQSDSLIGVIECAGGEEVGGTISLYNQCYEDGLSGIRCLADLIDNDHIKRSADCLNAGDELDIASCITQANTGINTAATMQCLDASAGPVEQISCLADGKLDEQQQLFLACAEDFPTITSFASCSMEDSGLLTTEQWKTAECMLEGNVSATSVLDCAGGRFASVEIAQCIAGGVELSQCFETETIISDIISDTAEDILDVKSLAVMENEIAMFRENLYALEGGDLAAVLANPSSTEWLQKTNEVVSEAANETVKEATKAADSVKKNVKEATRGLLNKIGF